VKAKGFIKRIDVNYHNESVDFFGAEPSVIQTAPPTVEVEFLFTEGEGMSELINSMKMGEPLEIEIGYIEEVSSAKKINKWRLIRL
jgi:hypothetical protein